MQIKISDSLRVPVEIPNGDQPHQFVVKFRRVENIIQAIEDVRAPANEALKSRQHAYMEVKERLDNEGMSGETLTQAIGLEMLTNDSLIDADKAAEQAYTDNMKTFLDTNLVGVDMTKTKFVGEDGKALEWEVIKSWIIDNVENREPVFAALEDSINHSRTFRKDFSASGANSASNSVGRNGVSKGRRSN